MDLDNLKKQIIPVLRKNNVTKAGLFGSVLRTDFNEKSDIDILVEIEGEKTLYDVIGLKIELEELLNRKVDLVQYNGIIPYIKDRVLDSEFRLCE